MRLSKTIITFILSSILFTATFSKANAEKLLAAIRYGIKTVIIPKENEKDLVEIQKDIQNKLIIKKVEFAREVLDLALDGKISKINKKLDWRHLVTESMKSKNQQNQEKTFVN